MKIPLAVFFTVYTTFFTTYTAMKVGEMASCSAYTWDLPLWALALTLIPAELGYLYAKAES